MTPAELRTVAVALGWPLQRLAGALGVSASIVDKWLAGRPPSTSRAGWLGRLHAVTPAPTPERPHRVLLDVDAPPDGR